MYPLCCVFLIVILIMFANHHSNDRCMVEANDSQKKYWPELEGQKTVDAVKTFADNLCHPNKAVRVATLRILSHYEPISCEIISDDQPPQKKMKTDSGVSQTSNVEYNGCNV